jgi:hypothetical protein
VGLAQDSLNCLVRCNVISSIKSGPTLGLRYSTLSPSEIPIQRISSFSPSLGTLLVSLNSHLPSLLILWHDVSPVTYKGFPQPNLSRTTKLEPTAREASITIGKWCDPLEPASRTLTCHPQPTFHHSATHPIADFAPEHCIPRAPVRLSAEENCNHY